jgi:hypothetical protein
LSLFSCRCLRSPDGSTTIILNQAPKSTKSFRSSRILWTGCNNAQGTRGDQSLPTIDQIDSHFSLPFSSFFFLVLFVCRSLFHPCSTPPNSNPKLSLYLFLTSSSSPSPRSSDRRDDEPSDKCLREDKDSSLTNSDTCQSQRRSCRVSSGQRQFCRTQGFDTRSLQPARSASLTCDSSATL